MVFSALGIGHWRATAGDSGQVTFQTGGDSNAPVLWRIQAKVGAQPENLTTQLDRIAPFTGSDTGPISVSPDGLWYVFESSRFAADAAGSAVLTLAPADLSSAETVRSSSGVIFNEGLAQAVPGGGAIVFSAGGGTHTRDLFVIRRSDTGWAEPESLTASSPFAYHAWPVLSADATKLVMNASDVDQDGGSGTRIAEVKLDGSGFRVLVSPDDGPPGGLSTYCAFPAYTPDGENIVFEATWAGSEQVWQRNLAGGPVSLLNEAFTNDNSPNVLPDGWIASLWLESPTGMSRHEIKLSDPTGRNYFVLTSTNSPFYQVDDIGMGTGPMWLPELAISRDLASLQISWPARFSDFVLQASTNLVVGRWTDVATTSNTAAIKTAGDALYFRLRK